MRTGIPGAPATCPATATSIRSLPIPTGRNCESWVHHNVSPACSRPTPSFVSSSEIQSYLKGVVRHFDLDRFIRYNSKVTSAKWSASAGTWTVEVDGGQTITSEILVNASGILNNYKMPDIPGLRSFAGPVLHTAAWDPTVDLRGKRVAIIGSGASAIQVLPQIQPMASRVQVYIRTPSWICQPLGVPVGMDPAHRYSEEEKASFRSDGAAYLHARKEIESQFNSMFGVFVKGSPEQRDARARFEARMREVIQDPRLQEALIPDFEVGCRRVSPGEPFLRALQEANVEPVFAAVEKVSADGIVAGGVSRKTDVIVAATGFNTSFRPRFSIVGLDGVDLCDEWKNTATSYMGTGVAGFPNYLIFLGPNTPISNGSALGKASCSLFCYCSSSGEDVSTERANSSPTGPIEATSDYFIRLLRKMVRQRVKSFTVKPECQADFDLHTQTLMQDMVWTGTCRSWCK